ncbi:8-amino-7-oxononanoate synthase [Verrucomicrobia bacterium LW23]|nr:8-amino-7-oxononanoate synthase [Verrucomicrobia bacterium LW23]
MDISRALSEELAALEAAHFRRHLRVLQSGQGSKVSIGDEPLINFSSNDYLGLATHPALRAGAEKMQRRYGTGAGASRLVCGNTELAEELEAALARWKGTEAALVFSTGYAAATGAIPALVGQGDTVVLDKLCHASLIDGARLSGAHMRVFPHNNMARLEEILAAVRDAPPPSGQQRRARGLARSGAVPDRPPRVLICTESVFSMDGDIAPLRALVALKEKHGAWLMVDEAHATGVRGDGRAGLVEELELTGQVDVQMGTLSKALGSSGGYIAGCAALREVLINRARSFIYSTAPSPSVTGASLAAVELLQSDDGERRRGDLWTNIAALAQALSDIPGARRMSGNAWLAPGCERAESGAPPGAAASAASAYPASPIFAWITGTEESALALSRRLHEQGILAPAIRYPTVPRGTARIRLTVSAAHTIPQITQLAAALASAAWQVPPS